MTSQPSPFVCHVLVCVNDRQGARKACADGQSAALREALKEQVAARGWKPRVRVSACGCMGLCERGPNVMLYPQGVWFSGVGPGDLEALLEAVGETLEMNAQPEERRTVCPPLT